MRASSLLRMPIRLVLLGGSVLLVGCTPFWDRLTKPGPVTQANSRSTSHEVWCYHTLGDADCFAEAQNNDFRRLVAVDPPARTPLNAEQYGNALIRKGESAQ